MVKEDVTMGVDTPLAKGVAVIKEVVKTLPLTPGVYRMLDKDGTPLYIGKAKHLKKRVSSYTLVSKLPVRLQRMVAQTASMEIVTTHTEVEALLLESNLIKKLKPRYNILLRDDKSFPYILITKDHPYPRLMKHRGAQSIKGKYFGPFASVTAVEETLISLTKTFLLRTCSDSFFKTRRRPCLQYHIKRCSAPCVKKVTSKDYQGLVKQAQEFLSGKATGIQKDLAAEMQEASEAQEYEKAASFRDRIRMLTQIQSRQRINVASVEEADIIAAHQQANTTCVQIFFFRNGRNYGTESMFLTHPTEVSLEENMAAFLTQFYATHTPASHVCLSHKPAELALIQKTLIQHHKLKNLKIEVPKSGVKLDLTQHALINAKGALNRKFAETASFKKLNAELVPLFGLETPPARIEVYDNSHIQGANPYGVMVVATPEGFEKKSYRKFAIKEPGPEKGGDDYAMMREVLRRRFAYAKNAEWVLPDLILIDGGKGQLSAAMDVVKELDVDGVMLVAIAKGADRNAGRETFYMIDKKPFTLPKDDPVMHFLQRLRDEAHRFAIGSHRAGRQKALTKSLLDDVPGIGPKRKKDLLQHFGSARAVSQAGLKDLQSVKGINKSVARVIYDYFHG